MKNPIIVSDEIEIKTPEKNSYLPYDEPIKTNVWRNCQAYLNSHPANMYDLHVRYFILQSFMKIFKDMRIAFLEWDFWNFCQTFINRHIPNDKKWQKQMQKEIKEAIEENFTLFCNYYYR
jgi:hypothetical protein